MEEIDKRFHLAAGRCWHEPGHDFGVVNNKVKCAHCGEKIRIVRWTQYGYDLDNPDYCADPRLVIAVMREREDFDLFVYSVGATLEWASDTNAPRYLMPLDLIMDRTGKLAALATEWLEKEKGKLKATGVYNTSSLGNSSITTAKSEPTPTSYMEKGRG